MFIRSWIRLVALTVSRHRSLIQQHPKAITNAISCLLEFICQNSQPAEYGSAIHEYLVVAVSNSSPIADALQKCICQRITSYPINPTLVESVLRVVTVVGGGHCDLKRVAVVLESALEQFEGTRSFIFGLLPTGGLKELTAVCWQQGCLLGWYCLVTNQGKIEVEDGSYILEQLLSNCKSLSLRYINFRVSFAISRLVNNIFHV
jgi:hypothetical protein